MNFGTTVVAKTEETKLQEYRRPQTLIIVKNFRIFESSNQRKITAEGWIDN
jgi:hypothetical protein